MKRFEGIRVNRRGIFGSRAAFTLVELLMVVAIISVLAALLLPALATSRALAQQTFCAGNLRQVHMGIVWYADDHGAWVPEWYDTAAGIGWWQKLNVYLRQPPRTRSVAFVCPAQRKVNYLTLTPGPALNYACNASAMFDVNSQWKEYRRIRITHPKAGRIMAVADAGETAAGIYYWYRGDTAAFVENRLGWPHQGRANFVFFDGHIDSSPQFFQENALPAGWLWSDLYGP